MEGNVQKQADVTGRVGQASVGRTIDRLGFHQRAADVDRGCTDTQNGGGRFKKRQISLFAFGSAQRIA